MDRQVKYKARSLRELMIKGVLTEREGNDFEAAFDCLWRIRNELHYLSGRKNDQIHFDQQEKIAAIPRLSGRQQGALAVEKFMQDYYSHATRVEHLRLFADYPGDAAGWELLPAFSAISPGVRWRKVFTFCAAN